jgi:hypothetical protein
MSTFTLMLPYIQHTIGSVFPCIFHHIPGKIYFGPNCPVTFLRHGPMAHYNPMIHYHA